MTRGGRAPEVRSDGTDPIEPFGGQLVDRSLDLAEAAELRAEAGRLPVVQLAQRAATDLYLLAVGALSPLEGFMDRGTYEAVLDRMALPSGLPWTIPVVLPAPATEADRLRTGDVVALRTARGAVAGTLEVTDVFAPDLERESRVVYGTTDRNHPGVAAQRSAGDPYVAGPGRYTGVEPIGAGIGREEVLTPTETRSRFRERGWRSVVAFQTRNPIHRAHEYLQKCALELVDGLLVHPVVGETKADDLPAELRMKCYRVLLDRYFPADRVLLSALPLSMRYAGPREAVFHAIIRRNYGCTHMIVGRDHAGVGDYYGTYDAQRIFDEIDPEVLGIQPLRFENAFWCRATGQMATEKTSPAADDERVALSGTRLREMLSRGERPPPELTRPEVAEILLAAYARQS